MQRYADRHVSIQLNILAGEVFQRSCYTGESNKLHDVCKDGITVISWFWSADWKKEKGFSSCVGKDCNFFVRLIWLSVCETGFELLYNKLYNKSQQKDSDRRITNSDPVWSSTAIYPSDILQPR